MYAQAVHAQQLRLFMQLTTLAQIYARLVKHVLAEHARFRALLLMVFGALAVKAVVAGLRLVLLPAVAAASFAGLLVEPGLATSRRAVLIHRIVERALPVMHPPAEHLAMLDILHVPQVHR